MEQIAGLEEGRNAHGVGRQWGLSRRLEFLEKELFWKGRINRVSLMEEFGVSAQQASRDLTAYGQMAPQNLIYDRSAKTYRLGPNFSSAVTTIDAEAYLATIASLHESTVVQVADGVVPTATTPRPHRRLNPQIVRLVLEGIRTGRSLCISYQSMQSEHPTERKITGHALGHDGSRWHVRAFAHDRGDFRDFVLSRILNATLSEPIPDSSPMDHDWFQMVNLELIPNPLLSGDQRRVLIYDWEMNSMGKLELPCRKSMVIYLVRQLRLDEDPTVDPSKNQIILANPSAAGITASWAGPLGLSLP